MIPRALRPDSRATTTKGRSRSERTWLRMPLAPSGQPTAAISRPSTATEETLYRTVTTISIAIGGIPMNTSATPRRNVSTAPPK